MSEHEDELPASKTQRKREMQELVEKAQALMGLKPTQWQRLPLGDQHQRALDESTRIRHPDARRRHAHHLARMLEDDTGEAIIQAMDRLNDPARQKRLRDWLEKIMAVEEVRDGETLVADVLDWYPDADRQHLRNLIRNAIKHRAPEDADKPTREKAKREHKKLAQYLNELERQAPLY